MDQLRPAFDTKSLEESVAPANEEPPLGSPAIPVSDEELGQPHQSDRCNKGVLPLRFGHEGKMWCRE